MLGERSGKEGEPGIEIRWDNGGECGSEEEGGTEIERMDLAREQAEGYRADRTGRGKDNWNKNGVGRVRVEIRFNI